MVALNGRFQPGESGNPGGRKKEIEGLAKMIRAELEKNAKEGGVNMAVSELLDIVRDAEEAKDRIAAIKVLLEYGYGKPTQEIQHEIAEGLTTIFEAMRSKNG